MAEFRNYLSYSDEQEVEHYVDAFNENNIKYNISKSTASVDVTFTGNNPTQFWLQILDTDFNRANHLIEELNKNNAIEQDHYLNDFTDNELIEIIHKYDEWSKLDFQLARDLLQKRGQSYTDAQISEIKKKRLAQLEQPEKVKRGWILFGYITAFLGGFIAVVIGFSIYGAKKVMPDGRKVYTYDEISRWHAKVILGFGTVFLIIGVLYKVFLR
ncbi:hypothetical protein [Labilibacter marinus]|uniref:hypothetical protein n=1 Tax=Labilibacter marinus TaxID=1477105 RepID=UPI00082C23E7|nr:hypothetical protein [Labilibacter marinus]